MTNKWAFFRNFRVPCFLQNFKPHICFALLEASSSFYSLQRPNGWGISLISEHVFSLFVQTISVGFVRKICHILPLFLNMELFPCSPIGFPEGKDGRELQLLGNFHVTNVTAGFFATFLAAAGVGYSVATNVKMEDMPQLDPRWTVIPFPCTRCVMMVVKMVQMSL